MKIRFSRANAVPILLLLMLYAGGTIHLAAKVDGEVPSYLASWVGRGAHFLSSMSSFTHFGPGSGNWRAVGAPRLDRLDSGLLCPQTATAVRCPLPIGKPGVLDLPVERMSPLPMSLRPIPFLRLRLRHEFSGGNDRGSLLRARPLGEDCTPAPRAKSVT